MSTETRTGNETRERRALAGAAVVGLTEALARIRSERAVLTGDAALARAVAYRANEAGDAGVVNKYQDSDPDARKAWEEWADAHEDLQRLQNFGPDLAFGYSELEEPREMRHPEAKDAAPDAA